MRIAKNTDREPWRRIVGKRCLIVADFDCFAQRMSRLFGLKIQKRSRSDD